MSELNTDRRKLLLALGALSVGSVAGVGASIEGPVRYTTASSTETCSEFTLNAEWRETVTRDDETTLLENTTASTDTQTGIEDTDPSIISLRNVLPGDRGAVSFQLTADPQSTNQNDTEVEPKLSINITQRAENGINNPEKTVGDDSSGDTEGELQNFLDVKVWKDTGLLGIDELGAANLEQEFGEPTISEGTLEKVESEVHGEPLGTIDSTTDESVTVTFRWEFSPDVDSDPLNVTQSDSVTFSFDIGCENS